MRCPGAEYNAFWDAPKRVNLAAAAGGIVIFPAGEKIASGRFLQRHALRGGAGAAEMSDLCGRRGLPVSGIGAVKARIFVRDHPRRVGNEGVAPGFRRASPEG